MAEAKAQLSALIDKVEKGEAVALRRRGVPVAKIVPANVTLERPMAHWQSAAGCARSFRAIPDSGSARECWVAHSTDGHRARRCGGGQMGRILMRARIAGEPRAAARIAA
ncbi:MAG: type II toxin-antitoxin system Phd/YefM family antitoxin [Betaproteobacteria bacterium]|nr:type II toxin-antitoxin system Phd/YefM family antitoxin [Betaproteobacteria bacterium]